jgi:hypothetical protein
MDEWMVPGALDRRVDGGFLRPRRRYATPGLLRMRHNRQIERPCGRTGGYVDLKGHLENRYYIEVVTRGSLATHG